MFKSNRAVASIKALKNHDLVFIHVEAPDEAGHAQDIKEKIKAIEKIDQLLHLVDMLYHLLFDQHKEKMLHKNKNRILKLNNLLKLHLLLLLHHFLLHYLLLM